MKIRTIICVLGCALAVMACKNEETQTGYIGPSDISVEGGVMTPEIMLNLGRLSDPQLSPDGTKILYGDQRALLTLFPNRVSCTLPLPSGAHIKILRQERFSSMDV